MRVIAGEHRGRTLIAPSGDATRPITDRAKQSLFDAIAPQIPEAIVFDCFCGTGSMGLECLSRGAARAFFFDADRGALSGLYKNIAALGVADASTVLFGDLFKHIRVTELPKADLIFFDPPYPFLNERPADLVAAAARFAEAFANDDAELIFRHGSADMLVLPPWTSHQQKEYGSMAIERLRLPPRD